MPFTIDLSDKTVVITGISSGIGAGIAKMYARANANIIGCALEAPNHAYIQNFYDVVRAESGKKPLYFQVDVTRKNELEEFIANITKHVDCIDILASNAGANIYRSLDQCSLEDWQYNLNLNLESHWHLAKLCKPYLDKSGSGVIVINSSAHSSSTISGSFPYNIAKTALRALIQTLTVEWSPLIRTVGVAPGFIDTKLAEEYFNTFSDPGLKRRETEQAHPLNRLGTAEEIGGWFVFLSSQYAAFSGGQTYLIDGGRSAVMI